MKCGLIPLLCLMLFSLSACEAKPSDPVTKWLESARLDADETPEELYAAALNEDILTIYSNTTRIHETISAFEAEYPGLSVSVQFLRVDDAIALIDDNPVFGELPFDLLIANNMNAALSGRFHDAGLLHRYVPTDIAENIRPEYQERLLDFMVEACQLVYNTEVYDAPPIDNLWELTEPRFYGKICMVDPLRSFTTNSLLCAVIEHSEEMAAAYEMLYGRPLAVPEGGSAGQEFWRMLLHNNILFTSSSEEGLEMVGMPGQTDPPVALMVSSKVRKTDIGFAVAGAYGLIPSSGAVAANSISIVGGTKNVNSAKLFIRYLLGEKDGHGAGYEPYWDEGSWTVRYDVESRSEVSLQDAGFWSANHEYYTENNEWIEAWWQELREEYAKE